jgi:hypothetical protein
MNKPMNDRGQGRKPLNESGELMKSRPIRMTDAEWEKCKALGGAAWVRKKIEDAALTPKERKQNDRPRT